jgi:hypothetical protein
MARERVEKNIVRKVDDFPIGSVWINVDSFGHWPVVVIDHWKPRPKPKGSIDYFTYVDLLSGKTTYCFVGSRSIEKFMRVT